jgi:hypothetical protein
MREHGLKIAAIYPRAARLALVEVFGLVGGRIDRLAGVFSARDAAG